MSTPLNGSLIKAFDILGLFTEERTELSATVVARQLGLNTSTAHRFMLTLEHVGALTSLRRGYFSLGPRLEELGRVAERTNPLPDFVRDVLETVSSQLNESVMACRLNRFGPVCVAVAESERPISVVVRTGTILPFRHTAQGKLWLAHLSGEDREAFLQQGAVLAGQPVAENDPSRLAQELDEIKRDGVAMNLGENEPDIAAVSVPVKNREGDMILSLSVFGMLSRFDKPFVDRARLSLSHAAAEIGNLFA